MSFKTVEIMTPQGSSSRKYIVPESDSEEDVEDDYEEDGDGDDEYNARQYWEQSDDEQVHGDEESQSSLFEHAPPTAEKISKSELCKCLSWTPSYSMILT